jgi:hypothetical protein
VGKLKPLEARETNMRKIGKIKLPPRTESILRVPETPEWSLVGITNKCKTQEGVIMAALLTNVADGYEMTSIRNINDTEA